MSGSVFVFAPTHHPSAQRAPQLPFDPMPSPRTHASAPDTSRPVYPRRHTYAEISKKPLHILLFLLPMLVLYELGSVIYLTAPTAGHVQIIEAQGMLAGIFRAFGAAGLHLPAIALVVVLLVQHVLARHRNTVRWRVLPIMAAESGATALPLLLMAMLLASTPLAQSVLADFTLASTSQSDQLATLSWQARATIALGAGLYEELLFRMILIEAVHLIAADLFRIGERRSRIAAVVVSAIAFAAYHDLAAPGGGIDAATAAFMLIAGIYFGLLYLWRIVVGANAVYDLIVLVAIGPAPPAG